MRMSTTNIKKKAPQVHMPPNCLHVKILDLVSNRINPHKKDLYYQHDACTTCIATSKKSTSDLSQKKNIKKSISQDKQKNRIVKQPQSQKATYPTTHNNSVLDLQKQQITKFTKDLKQKQPYILSIESKVLSLSIQNTNTTNLTIDLRGEIQNEFVSSRMLSKLKLQNLEKQQRIIQLQKQIQIKEFYIKELNKDIEYFQQFARRKSYSDNHLNNNEALSDIGHQPLSLKEVFPIQNSQNYSYSLNIQKKRSHERQQRLVKDYDDDLFRIIRTQAKQLQRIKNGDPFSRRLSIPKNN